MKTFADVERDTSEEKLIRRGVGKSDGTRPSRRKKTEKRLWRATPITSYSCLLTLLNQPITTMVVEPKTYFRASNELVVFTLAISWSVTLWFNPDAIFNHPARNFVGHLNPCFGWDYPPGSFFAIIGCAADVYLAWTYGTLECIRTKLQTDDDQMTWSQRFALYTSILHGFASLLWLLLWVVGPPDGRWAAHLAIFTTAVLFRYLCTLGNYIESRFGENQFRVKPYHTYFICFYGFVTFSLPCLYFYDVIGYQIQRAPNLCATLDAAVCAAPVIALLSSPRPTCARTLPVLWQIASVGPHRCHGGFSKPWTYCGWVVFPRAPSCRFRSRHSSSRGRWSTFTSRLRWRHPMSITFTMRNGVSRCTNSQRRRRRSERPPHPQIVYVQILYVYCWRRTERVVLG